MNKIIVLITSCIFLYGCGGVGSFGVLGAGFVCDSRYEKKKAAPFFEDIQIPEPGSKAVIILYQPYYQACGARRDRKVLVPVSINGELAVTNLANDYFTILRIAPGKVNFSATRIATVSGMTFTHKGGSLEKEFEAGKVYFVRWSNESKHRVRRGWFDYGSQFRIVDKQTALKELKGVLYTAPPLYKAPVFDKKTGEAL